MGIPIKQMFTVAKHVLISNIKGNKHYPLVLMLEPLYRCNLRCFGCGKVQHSPDILKKTLTVKECLEAIKACGAPMISLPGGEPLLHPEISLIVRELCGMKKYVYLCTNALLLPSKLDDFKPSPYLSFSIHLDGPEAEHDESVCLKGTYKKVIDILKEAVRRGFRVTTNTTLYSATDPERIRSFFDEMMSLGVEGMMISPGYPYTKAPVQDRFMLRKETIKFFRKILYNPNKKWRFNQSPLFLEYLAGARHFSCTPWGSPAYNVLGWQRPCYLFSDGYEDNFNNLINNTKWEDYGYKSENPACSDCMVHSGHEPSAVAYTFGSLKGLFETIRAIMFGPNIPHPDDEIIIHT